MQGGGQREQVSALIVAESDTSRAGIDGLFAMLAKDAGDDAEDDIEACGPLYNSIVSNPDGSVSIAGLSPALPADQPTMPHCYALLVRNAGENIDDRAADAEREADNLAADKLAEAYLMAHPDKAEQAGAEIGLAMADLDRIDAAVRHSAHDLQTVAVQDRIQRQRGITRR